jgi:DMSO/TMAO reductase YedYZ heme-binding membrane subunit
VQAASVAVKRLPKKAWRVVHLGAYAAFWLTSIHAALAGTDSSRPLYVAASLAAVMAVLFAACFRVLVRGRRRRLPSSQVLRSAKQPEA